MGAARSRRSLPLALWQRRAALLRSSAIAHETQYRRAAKWVPGDFGYAYIPHPLRMGVRKLTPIPSVVAGPAGRWPAFCPLRVHTRPLRVLCPLRGGPAAAASRCGSGVPALASLAHTAPQPSPPGLSARPCAPLRGSCGSRCVRCAFPSPRCAAAFRWSALLRSGAGLRFASARRVPPGLPASRLRGRRLPPRGRGGLRPPFLRPAPGAFFCCARASPACYRPGFSPLSPPAPTPPLGASGSAWPDWVGFAPHESAALLAALSRLPPRAARAPVRPPGRSLQSENCKPGILHELCASCPPFPPLYAPGKVCPSARPGCFAARART